MDSPPAELPRHCGLVATALHFLAGYGLYLNVSTDRFISRLLDNLNPAPPQPLHGPFHPSRFEAAARFARCGTIAKQLLAQDVPPSRWGEAELWSNLLPEHLPLSSQACARAARAALQQADSDWQQECLIFHVAAAPAPPEDWRDVAWEDPWLPSGDPRSGHLLTLLCSETGASPQRKEPPSAAKPAVLAGPVIIGRIQRGLLNACLADSLPGMGGRAAPCTQLNSTPCCVVSGFGFRVVGTY